MRSATWSRKYPTEILVAMEISSWRDAVYMIKKLQIRCRTAVVIGIIETNHQLIAYQFDRPRVHELRVSY